MTLMDVYVNIICYDEAYKIFNLGCNSKEHLDIINGIDEKSFKSYKDMPYEQVIDELDK